MANVIDKTKRQYLRSVHTPDYCRKDRNGDVVMVGGKPQPLAGFMINPDVSAVLSTNPRYWDFDDDNNAVVEKSQADKDTADADSANLGPMKADKYHKIDLRTMQLIAAGFTYNAKTFSLSDNAQKKIITWKIKADNGDETARTAVTIDNADTEILADAAEVSLFYDAAFDKVQDHIDSGEAVRASVRAATDVPAVGAVADNR